MPLLGNGEYREAKSKTVDPDPDQVTNASRKPLPLPTRRQSQHSGMAKTAIMSHFPTPTNEESHAPEDQEVKEKKSSAGTPTGNPLSTNLMPNKSYQNADPKVLSDTPVTTPATTAPSSPVIVPRRRDSGSSTPSRPRAATTLDIPGLTKSRVSPDGRIASRDVGSKLVVVMVGLPARGKSYITKKMARYLNWLQHDTKIFNVGEKRRTVAGGPVTRGGTLSDHKRPNLESHEAEPALSAMNGTTRKQETVTPPTSPSTRILINGDVPPETPAFEKLPSFAMDFSDVESESKSDLANEEAMTDTAHQPTYVVDESEGDNDIMDQSANFFDPNNEKASIIREQVAMETLDDLLDFVLDQGGSVGIFDATNSTLERRRSIVAKVRARAGPDLGILFLESLCIDETLLESNMRLKLSGPDYKDTDPVIALKDFKNRVAMYQKKYVSLGEYEEKNNMPYIQMIDVGRKIISHQIKGFLSAQTNYYLLNFNLAPRQIWITRHGESVDNINGKIGGDSQLTERGQMYAKTLTAFVNRQRELWEIHQQDKLLSTHFPPQPGDTTPPNPEYTTNEGETRKNFCVWTSMLKRSIQTAQYFDEEEYDVKQMRMLDELNAGVMEGLTYDEIRVKFADDYDLRKQDKLHYRYPGAGGEGYLDIINRLRPVIHEVERMTDHVILVGHRSVARVLLAYFKGLKREDVANLDVPLGMLYMLEPKPYGVEFKAYRYDAETQWFHLAPEYVLKRAGQQTAC